jgi:hypothetical protein
MSAIRVVWHDDEHTIINMEFQAGWTWDEYRVGFREVFALADTVTHPVFCLQTNAVAEARRVPGGTPMQIINELAHEKPNNLAAVYVIDAAALSKVIINIFNRLNLLSGFNVTAVNTLQDALAQIETGRSRG